MATSFYTLGIESSCDDTAAAVLCDGKVLSNCIANQEIHQRYGGVVPELASRAHQSNIVPVVHDALQKAGIRKEELHLISFTQGPGLLGSLLVGSSFAKSLAMGLNIPFYGVNHMQAHVLASFFEYPEQKPPTGPASKRYSWSLYNLAGIVTDPASNVNAIASITAAIETVTEQRAEYGAMQTDSNTPSQT